MTTDLLKGCFIYKWLRLCLNEVECYLKQYTENNWIMVYIKICGLTVSCLFNDQGCLSTNYVGIL